MKRIVPILLVCLATVLPAVAQNDGASKPEKKRDPRDLPVDSNVVEQVAVELAEVHLLVTDRRGKAITDLEATEITVFENGKPQKLAYVDNVGGTRIAGQQDDAPPPAVVYDHQGTQIDSELDAVLPAKALRRVVLAFDVKNSKLNIRERWRQAAEDWVRTKMADDDQVAVVLFRSYPMWLVPFTNDRDEVLTAIEAVSLDQGIQDRDKRRDVSRLVDDIHTLCSDLGRANDRQKRGSGRGGSQGPATDEQSCAYNIAEAQVQQWDSESKETLATLRGLTGQLAAISGRKIVIVFSEGWVADASTAGTNAMLAVFGSGKVDSLNVRWSLDRDSLREITDLHLTARAADVSFFTIDTTRGADSGIAAGLERGQHLAYQREGINPWSEMNWETRQNLNALAKETGGRSYHGAKELEKKIEAAANSFFGYYVIGYYRSDPKSRAGKVRVKVDREKLDVGYPEKPTLWPHVATQVRLDLSVGQPTVAMTGLGYVLPLKFTMNLEDIPLRRGAGARGAQLGVYLQAIRPDGTVVSERLDVATVVLERNDRRVRDGKAYEHVSELVLPDGPYRIRARISDDRQQIVAERVVDLTLRAGAVFGGFERAGVSPD